MCYLNNIKWEKCGHYTTITEACSEARKRNPPALCTSVHAPKATMIPQQICPDLVKHPRGEGDGAPSMAHTPTYGDGNSWYRGQQRQR